MKTGAGKQVDRAALVIGLGLLGLAALAIWDARRLTLTSVYGMGPEAMPYAVAAGLVALAIGHLVVATRGGLPPREAVDLHAILWIALGLAALIGSIGLGGGFIPAVALLFAATARAFGRRAFAADLAIGLAMGLLTYLMFTKLLTLSLPEGPLERLL